MTPEEKYISETDNDHRKKYAQFFTPEEVADFMCSWVIKDAIEDSDKSLLEPAFGLGIFTRKLRREMPNLRIKAYDIDCTIFQRAKRLFEDDERIQLSNEDFLCSPWDESYDYIVCNPPYLKFHNYNNCFYIKGINDKLNVKLKGSSNMYTLFLLKSIAQLNEGGKLAFIIPSEFLNADYGVEVKRFLIESGVLEHLIVIDYNQNTFDGAITTACILLCSKTSIHHSIKFSVADNSKALPRSLISYREYRCDELEPATKWRKYYEEENKAYENLVPFSTFAKVARGIATGANDYFTFNKSKAESYKIPQESLVPCICRSADVTTNFFTRQQFLKLKEKDKNIYLFNGLKKGENEEVKAYLRKGIEDEIDRRYLTSCRTPWYALEKRKPAPIWVGVFNRGGLKFVRNKAGVANLTTFHCVYPNHKVDLRVLFVYLLTDLAKEIFTMNARQYGNGLIKFEPNDLNKGMALDLRLLTQKERDIMIKAYSILEYGGEEERKIIIELDNFLRHIYSASSTEEEVRRMEELIERSWCKYTSQSEMMNDVETDATSERVAVQLTLF